MTTFNEEAITEEYLQIKEAIDEFEDWELSEDEYDEILDELFGDVDVAGIKVSTSQVLYDVDPIRYKIGLGEEENYQKEQKRDEIQEAIDNFSSDFGDEVDKKVKELQEMLDEVW